MDCVLAECGVALSSRDDSGIYREVDSLERALYKLAKANPASHGLACLERALYVIKLNLSAIRPSGGDCGINAG